MVDGSREQDNACSAGLDHPIMITPCEDLKASEVIADITGHNAFSISFSRAILRPWAKERLTL
jgi:hypothetical protein